MWGNPPPAAKLGRNSNPCEKDSEESVWGLLEKFERRLLLIKAYFDVLCIHLKWGQRHSGYAES
jgi:hypothetical protein